MNPTPEQVATQVAFLLKRRPEARAIGIYAPAGWTGGDRLLIDNKSLRVAFCRSPLELSERLSSMGEHVEEPLVLLTSCPEQALSLDVRARLAGRRLVHVDPWEMVRAAFSATHIDPRLPAQGWVADKLLDAVTEGGFTPVCSGWLDVETVWQTLFQHYLQLDAGRPDAADLIQWSAGEGVSRYDGLEEPFRLGIRERLAESAGELGQIFGDTLEAGHGMQLLPIGLACEVLCAGGEQRSAALSQAVARLEPYVGGRTLNLEQGRAWFDAAKSVLDRLPTEGQKGWTERAEKLLAHLKASQFAGQSTVFRTGFQQRLEQFGRALNRCLDGKTVLGEVEAVFKEVLRHRESEKEWTRVERLEMALRLMRRLDRGGEQPVPSFGESIAAYVKGGAFMDWARRYLLGGDPIAELSKAFGRLYRSVRELRERENRLFAERLREWNRAPKTDTGFLPVEQFLDRVVAKVAVHEPVLVVVIDGMDASVFEELSDDLKHRGWFRWSYAADAARGALLSVLPTVTKFSRTALLTGRVASGSSVHEKAGFANHTALRSVSRPSRPPVLYHKGELTDAAAQGLSLAVREAIANPEQRVVGVVINAVDDHLAKSEQLRVKWTEDLFRFVDALLYEARVAGRGVVVTADHGHVLEEGGTRLPGGAEERWRLDGEPLLEQEIAFEGPRIKAATDQERVVLLWSESARYCQKKNGYHGGATAQEVVVPLGVFLSVGQELKGWQPVPEYAPEWWLSPAGGEAAVPPPIKKRTQRTLPPKGQASLFDALNMERTAPTAEWLRELLESEIYRAQLRLAGRLAPPTQILHQVLDALQARHGRAPSRVLAQAIEVPEFRIRGILAGLQRVLNVDGYQVLSLDEAAGNVALDIDLLKKQFQLGERP